MSKPHPLSPSSSMAEVYKTTYKRQGVLLPQIERHVLRKAAEPNDRSSTVLHPSEMARNDWCGRHDYYRVIGTPTDPQKLSTSFRMENIYEEGHSIHNKWQRWLADMGILWGNWECKECETLYTRQLRPAKCSHINLFLGVECESDQFRYKEVPIVSEQYLVAGHADGITITDKPRLIEIKTIGLGSIRYYAPLLYNEFEDKGLSLNDLWYRVNRPFGSHVKQAMLYLHIARQMGHPDLEDMDEIVFIYEYKPTQDAKEFVVKYNISLIEDRLDEAEAVVEAVKTGIAPPRPEAYEQAGPTGSVCSNCEYRTTCWGSSGASATVPSSPKSPVVVRRASAARRRTVVRR